MHLSLMVLILFLCGGTYDYVITGIELDYFPERNLERH